KTTFIKGTPFAHAPSMMRTAAFQAVNGYSDERRLLRVEDYHLWIKLYAAGYSGQNILEPLYKMRDDRNATNRRKYKYRMNEAYVRYVAFKKLDLPLIGLAYVFRPLIVGLLPTFVYEILHKKRLAK
ncbi:MAG: glycosyltransferase family 2 protein, partial [Culicoidibacterales bacterium]